MKKSIGGDSKGRRTVGPTGEVDVNVGYEFVVQFIGDVHSGVLVVDMHVEITLSFPVNIAMSMFCCR